MYSMYTYYFKEIRQFLTQSSSIELLHLITKCATGRRSFVCRGTDGMFPAYRYCVKSKNKKNSDIKFDVRSECTQMAYINYCFSFFKQNRTR